MALSPGTQRAIERAIKALHSEAGDAAQFKSLLNSMKAAVGSVNEGSEDQGSEPAAERDGEKDDYSFDTAQRRHKERITAASAAEAKAEAAAGGEGK